MSEKTLLELGYEIISKSESPVSFKDIWAFICETKGFTKEQADAKISQFYTSLSLDGRFANLGDNTWGLRERYTFEQVHPEDMRANYSNEDDIDDEDNEDPEDQDEKEYNASFAEHDENDEVSDHEPDIGDDDYENPSQEDKTNF